MQVSLSLSSCPSSQMDIPVDLGQAEGVAADRSRIQPGAIPVQISNSPVAFTLSQGLSHFIARWPHLHNFRGNQQIGQASADCGDLVPWDN